MGQKITIDDKEYELDKMSEQARKVLVSLQFATQRMQELNNLKALLECAKNSYVNNLKKEMLSDKAGFFFTED